MMKHITILLCFDKVGMKFSFVVGRDVVKLYCVVKYF